MDTMQKTFDRAAEDLGNSIHLEHVNVTIPDQRVASLFYGAGLGLTRDPYLQVDDTNMWMNAGRSQFHLPTGPAQVLRGKTGLVIENREALEEIPFESDFGFFFKEFDDPLVCYWHDTGHAQIKENLGFIGHAMHLESMANRLAGFHIHDVQFPGRDHCPPGSGMIDFAALKPFVRPEHLKVFELNPGVPVEELRRGVAHVKSIWGET